MSKITSLGDCFRVTKSSGMYYDAESKIQQIIPVYYWLEHHHGGQWSWEYAAFCRLGRTFDPGYGGLSSEEHDVVGVYNDLCAANGCDHEPERERWHTVVFLHDHQDPELDKLMREGSGEDIARYLSQWDMGDESCCDEPSEQPWGSDDQVFSYCIKGAGCYALALNHGLGYAALHVSEYGHQCRKCAAKQ